MSGLKVNSRHERKHRDFLDQSLDEEDYVPYASSKIRRAHAVNNASYHGRGHVPMPSTVREVTITKKSKKSNKAQSEDGGYSTAHSGGRDVAPSYVEALPGGYGNGTVLKDKWRREENNLAFAPVPAGAEKIARGR